MPVCGETKGEKAALEILGQLEGVKIRFMKLPKKKPKKRIKKRLMSLLLETSRAKDEATEGEDIDLSSLDDREDSVEFVPLGKEEGAEKLETNSKEGDKKTAITKSSGKKAVEDLEASETFISKDGKTSP